MFESASAVYWRRRAVAIAGTVAVALLLVWAFSGPSAPVQDAQAVPDLNAAASSSLNLQEATAGEPVLDPADPEEPASDGPDAAASSARSGLPAAGVPASGESGSPGGTARLPGAGPPAAGPPAARSSHNSGTTTGFPPAGSSSAGSSAGEPPVAGRSSTGSAAAGSTATGPAAAGPSSPGQLPALPGRLPGQIPGAHQAGGTPAGIPATASRPGARSPATDLRPGATGAQSDPAGVRPGVSGTRSGDPVRSPSASARPVPRLTVPASGAASGQPAQAAARPVQGRPAQPATTVKPCADRAVSVTAKVDEPTYKLGERPKFQLLVTNVGNVPCTRDLDAGLQELVVTGPAQARAWSSNDCFPARKPDVRTLAPGKPLVFALEWSGRTSSPGCPGHRATVGPGDYQVVGKLGTLSSAPAVFRIAE